MTRTERDPAVTATPEIAPGRFREVLAHHPTGVAVVTAIGPDDVPVGMAVGTLVSVSLDPALIGFLPDRGSTTFPHVRAAASFCVNVLAEDQAALARSFAATGTDRFAGVSWTPAPSGAPRLEGVTAWIDCELESVSLAGDHFFVLGRVLDLAGHGARDPLVFVKGSFGGVSRG